MLICLIASIFTANPHTLHDTRLMQQNCPGCGAKSHELRRRLAMQSRIHRVRIPTMWYRIERAADNIMRAVVHMDSQQWIMISCIAIVLGAIFLRGYGSRTSY